MAALVNRSWYVLNVFQIDPGVGNGHRAPSQYPKRRLFVRSRKVSKPRDLYLELSDRSEIWQALRQQCCRCACQISKRYDNLKYQSRGFETLRDLKKLSLFGYWDGAQVPRIWLIGRHLVWNIVGYTGCNACRQTSIKSQNLNVSLLVLRLSLPNPLKPDDQWRMKI